MADQTVADKSAQVEQVLFRMFGGEDEAPAAPAQPGRPRELETGRFAPQGHKDGAEAQPGGGTDEPAGAEPQGTEGEGQEPALSQSEEVEVFFDIGGERKPYRIPKEISDRFIQHEDYTRKTQDIAEMRRGLSSQMEAARIDHAFGQSVAAERQHLTVLDAHIAQFQGVNWQQMETADLLRTRAQLDQLKDQRAEIAKVIEAKRGEFDQKLQQVTAEALASGQKFIEARIKGFGPQVQNELLDFGRSQGFLQEELSKVIDPRVVVTMWKAMQWDKLQASAPTVSKKAAQAAPVIRPGASVKQAPRHQQQLEAAKKAKTPGEKRAAYEDYFASKFGG